MLSSLFEIKSSLWNTKFMKGIKGSLSTGFSSVYYLYCQMQKSIKSFLQGLVLSQLIFPICIGHELLVLLPRPYVIKRCWLFLCMVFSHLGQSLSQGSAQLPVFTFPPDEQEHHLQTRDFPVAVSLKCLAGLPPRSHLPRWPLVVRSRWKNVRKAPI